MDYSKKFILLGLIAIAGTGHGFTISENSTDEKRKVEGGEPICIEKAPYQVYLKDANGYKCGGALIRPNLVLTAAHCLRGIAHSLFIVAGTDCSKLENNEAKDTGSITIRADGSKRHPKFTFMSEEDSLKYDIAIIKLKRDFPETQKISPVELTTVDVKEGDELLLTGIGKESDEYWSDLSPCLKAYKSNVVNCEVTLSSLRLPVNNYDGVICHKNPLGHAARRGDSGSPLVNQEGKLVGIHSSSYDNLCETSVNVFHNLDWIKEKIRLYTNEIL